MCVCGLCHLTLYYHRASVCEWSLSFDIVPRLSVYPVSVYCCVLSQSQRVCVWSLSFDIVLSQSQHVCVWSLSFDIVLSQSQHVPSLSFDIVPRLSVYPAQSSSTASASSLSLFSQHTTQSHWSRLSTTNHRPMLGPLPKPIMSVSFAQV